MNVESCARAILHQIIASVRWSLSNRVQLNPIDAFAHIYCNLSNAFWLMDILAEGQSLICWCNNNFDEVNQRVIETSNIVHHHKVQIATFGRCVSIENDLLFFVERRTSVAYRIPIHVCHMKNWKPSTYTLTFKPDHGCRYKRCPIRSVDENLRYVVFTSK